MTAQLDLLPGLEPLPEPHRFDPVDTVTGLGPCTCGALRLDEIHRPAPAAGAARFFDQLARLDRDTVAVTRATLTGRRDDLAALALADQHAGDERFRAGLAWGIALANLALAAIDGTTDPERLRFHGLTAP